MSDKVRHVLLWIISIASWPYRRWLRWRLRGKVSSVLVIRPDHLGDLLFASAALRYLRAGMVDKRIVLLVGIWNADLAKRYADNYDALLTLPFPGFTRQQKGGLLAPYRTLWQASRQLRRWQHQHGRLDLAINLRFDFWWGGLLCLLSGIPLLGYDTPLVKLVASQTQPYVKGRHEVEQNLALVQYVVKAWGQPTAVAAEPYFPINAAEHAWATNWLQAQGWRGQGKLLVIHPGAGDPTKQWPSQRWAATAQNLLYHREAWLLLTGSDAEQQFVNSITQVQPIGLKSRIHNIAGLTNLGQLAAILSQADLVMGVDSGPLHLASTLARPTLRLFGPSDATIWGPWPPDQKRNVVIKATQLDDITVDEVATAAQTMLDD